MATNIYIHYLEGDVMYVGETVNVFDGRPFESRNAPVDKIRWLRASQNDSLEKDGRLTLYVS